VACVAEIEVIPDAFVSVIDLEDKIMNGRADGIQVNIHRYVILSGVSDAQSASDRKSKDHCNFDIFNHGF
jgi:hypothetical protein